jgi:voltage-gated sodium channel
VIVRKSEEAYHLERESGIPLTQKEIMHEIKEIHRILEELEKRIGKDTGGPAASIS